MLLGSDCIYVDWYDSHTALVLFCIFGSPTELCVWARVFVCVLTYVFFLTHSDLGRATILSEE